MRSPGEALVWSAFRLSWPALLTQLAGVVGVVLLIDLALDADEDSLELLQAAELAIIASLFFLCAVTLHKSHGIARTASSLGFPYRAEFALPVSTLTLLLSPLLYLCLLMQVAVFVPIAIINAVFFNIEVSVLPISFTLFQFTAMTLMLSWWTENGIASGAAWLLALTLYLAGLLLPEFSRVENAWVILAEDPTDYAVSLSFTAMLFALTYYGVSRQRSGEALFETGNQLFSSAEQGAIRDLLPLPISDCPTSSPMAAEFWKENQLHGVYSAIFGGLTGAAVTLIILATIYFFAGSGPDPKNAGVLALPLYGLICIGLTVTLYGVRYRNGTPVVSLHDRTVPLSTAKLCLIRSSVALGSSLLAGLVMFLSLRLLGPFLLDNFQNIHSEFLASFTIFSGLGYVDLALRLFLALVAFLTALLLLATFFAWTMLHSRAIAIVAASVPAYIFLWSLALLAAYGDGDADAYDRAIAAVFANHLWALILSIPVALLIIGRDLLRDRVLTQSQMLILILLGSTTAGLYLAWLLDGDHYGVLERDICLAQLSYLHLQGFLPLLAAMLALWVSNRIRHG